MRRLVIPLILLFILPISALAAQKVVSFDNPNVAKPVWLLPDPSTNLVSAQITFEGGISLDPASKEGLVNLMGGLMLSGAGDLKAEALAQAMKDRALSISIDSRRDDTIVSLTVPAKYWNDAVALLGKILATPRFDQDEMDRAIAAQSASIRSDLSDPDWRAMRLMNGIVFDGSVYARPGAGNLSGLKRLTRQDFINVHRIIFGAQPVHATFVGHLERAQSDQLLSIFKNLSPAKEASVADYRHWQGPAFYHQAFDIPQTSLYYILPGLHAADPDYAALTVLNAALSDGFGSRLMKALREESGLSYGASGGISDARGGALWVFSVRVADAKLSQAANILQREIRKTADAPLPQSEIDKTAKILAAQLPMGWTSSPAIAAQLAEAQRDGFGPDYLEEWQKRLLAVRAEDVQRLAAKLLSSKNSVMIAVGRSKPDQSWSERPDLPNMD